jgi:fatty-acyl-CoA synthase
MIISGGVNIYPAEIEAVLYAHPGIIDAAVFGVPDEEWGEIVCAAIVPRPHATAVLDRPELHAHLARMLAPFKRPRRFTIVDALPETTLGKVDRVKARRQFAPILEVDSKPRGRDTRPG